MYKIIQYFYFFSKATTSLVFLLIIMLMGYLLYNSYKKINYSSNNVDTKLVKFHEEIINYSKKLTNIDNKIKNNEIILNKLTQNFEKINNLQENNGIKEEISNLNLIIKKLEKNLNDIDKNFEFNNEKKIISSNENRNQINNLINFILKKYEEGEVITNDLYMLEDIFPKKQLEIFEKINIIKLKKFYGLRNLNELFEISSSKYIKEKFVLKNKSSVIKFLFKFISVRPSNLNQYENNELNVLLLAKEKMESKKIDESLKLILSMDENEFFFKNWINQSKNYIDFTSLLNKLRYND